MKKLEDKFSDYIIAKEGETVGVNALLALLEDGSASAPLMAKPAASGGSNDKPATTETKGSDMAETVKVMVPSLGESVTEATVSTWFTKVGDTVAQDEMLCELETDKVSVEVPAPAAGVLAEILAPEGATVDAKAQLGVISAGAGAAAAAPKAAAAPVPAAISTEVIGSC